MGDNHMYVVGMKMGKLTLLQFYKKSFGREYWKCKCECGKYTTRNISHIKKSENKQHCGCQYKKYNGENSHSFTGYKEISGTYFGELKSRSKRYYKKPFNITLEYIWNLYLEQNKKCALTRLDIHFPNDKFTDQTASLDRIDSAKGYEIGNVQWLHNDVNMMKNDMKQEQFIQMCKFIMEKQNEKTNR